MNHIEKKIKEVFPDAAVLKNRDIEYVFVGRNLPSFVKDYIIKRYTDSNGVLNEHKIKKFFDEHMPNNPNIVKKHLFVEKKMKLFTRFTVQTDIQGGKMRFSIPDSGISPSETMISPGVIEKLHQHLDDGEKWGIIDLIYLQPGVESDKGVIAMVGFQPFKPYKVNLKHFRECRKQFTTEEWIDVLLSAMEYNPKGFITQDQKLEFLSRLLVFVEPRLNMIELAPKGTGKSYVFNNLSKYGWPISGGKVTRAKLFYNKTTRQPGIMKNYDFVAFDEIKTITFQDEAEIQAILKSYLEAGNATVDNYKFMSECGTMLMGNIELNQDRLPRHNRYFINLPDVFKESALLDRFHGFIEGWRLPRMDKSMILKGWTLNVEYFSEILHLLRNRAEYSMLVNDIVYSEHKSDLRDLKAVQRLATAYSKLLFPHIMEVEDLDKEEFERYCLKPAIRRRGIIKEQCHRIDCEFKETMPEIRIKDILEA